MLKSYEGLSLIWEAVIADAIAAYPTLRRELSKDKERFTHLLQCRGLPTLLVDLPKLAKHFDRCLANGAYFHPALPLSGPRRGGCKTPRFLGGLYLRVFAADGCLRDDADIEAIFFIRQLLLLGKKYDIDCPHAAKVRVVNDFLDCNSGLPKPSRFWETTEVAHCDPPSSDVPPGFARAATWISKELGHYDPEHWKCKHGPGAISKPDFQPRSKYEWTSWSRRLERRFPISDYGFHSYSSWASWASGDTEFCDAEPRSTVCLVPKTFSGPRLIASEPGEHMFLQQSMLRYFMCRTAKSALSRFADFRDQGRNRALCRSGSETATLATVDLSAASDTVATWHVEELFRSNPKLLIHLCAARTRYLVQDVSFDQPEEASIRMYATSGNATTFPVETLVFLAVALSVCAEELQCDYKDLEGKVSVFGDDIIIPVECRNSFSYWMTRMGFRINSAKSYFEGNFRESCGLDSFKGVDVSPFYLRGWYDKRDPSSLPRMVSAHNNAHKRGLFNVCEAIRLTLPKGLPWAPSGSIDESALKTFIPRPPTHRIRWNRDLQRFERHSPTLVSVSSRRRVDGDLGLFAWFNENPGPLYKWSPTIQGRDRHKIAYRWLAHDAGVAQAPASGSPSLS